MVFVHGTLHTGFALEKVWKIEIKSGKMVKSYEFFQSYSKCFICEYFFCFGVKCFSTLPVRLQCIIKKALCLCVLRPL